VFGWRFRRQIAQNTGALAGFQFSCRSGYLVLPALAGISLVAQNAAWRDDAGLAGMPRDQIFSEYGAKLRGQTARACTEAIAQHLRHSFVAGSTFYMLSGSVYL
jgi:hypothetical protein